MQDGRSIAYFAELGYNTDKPEPVEIRARGVRCLSGGIGCSAMDFSLAKGSGRGDSIFSFEKNRCFGFKAESEPTRKEEFLCLLKIRSIS